MSPQEGCEPERRVEEEVTDQARTLAPSAAASDESPRRWFSHQPNVTGQGIIASYSARFWALIVILGLLTGIAASLLMALLRLAQHLSYGYHSGTFLDGVRGAPGWRHLAALLAAALLVIVGLRLLGRLPASGGTEVSEALWLRRARLAPLPSLARGVLSIVTVGMGVSLGREGAPQLAGAATASRLADWAGLPLWQRRLLVAAGAGAGFAAVYNVPLGGTLFALEVLLGTVALPLVLPALATSVIATAVAWVTLGTGPTYHVPSYALSPSHLVWAALIGPLLGLLAVGWARVITWAGALRPRRWGRFAAPVVALAALGALSIPYPQLLGNGKNVVQLAVLGQLSLGLLAVLFALKPLATAACLGSGSPGGLFTPTFTIGVLFAGVTGVAWSHLWPGPASGSYALVGGGAFLAASMQGPLAGTVLVLELARHFDALMVPTLIAVTEATVIARRLGAHSIYSARLPRDTAPAVSPIPGSAAIVTLHALDETLPEEATRPPNPPEVANSRSTTRPTRPRLSPPGSLWDDAGGIDPFLSRLLLFACKDPVTNGWVGGDPTARCSRVLVMWLEATGAQTSGRRAGNRLRLAIIDRDSGFMQVLAKRLGPLGFEHRVLGSPPTPDALVAMRLNALVIDVALVGPGSWEYLERVCARMPRLAVIVCTGPSSVAQRVRGLRLGVDAWVTKPCHPEELIAVVEAALRRQHRAEMPWLEETIGAGEITIRPDLYQAYAGEISLDLSAREFELLRLLAESDRVLRREEIYERVWGYAMAHGDRSVDVFIRKLRQKLSVGSPGWSYIHTHFGVGYRFAPELQDGSMPTAQKPEDGGAALATERESAETAAIKDTETAPPKCPQAADRRRSQAPHILVTSR